MRLVVVRHGETEWNVHKMTQGMNNTSLNKTGVQQALSLSYRLSRMYNAKVISSPLKRAYDTACTIAYRNNFDLEIDENLREINFGFWEGLTFEQIRQRYVKSFDEWVEDPMTCNIPGQSETVAQVVDRVDTFFNSIKERFEKEKTIIAVSHSVPCKIMIAKSIGLPIKNMHALRLDNASISIIEYIEERPVLRITNDTSHIGRINSQGMTWQKR